MTKSEELLEVEIENEQYLESYKNKVIKDTTNLYKEFSIVAGRTIKTHLGSKISLATYHTINSSVKKSIADFGQQYKDYIASEVENASEVFIDIERAKIKKITGEDPKIPVIALAPLMRLQIPLEGGRVVSINGMIDVNIDTIERDMKNVSSRLRIVKEQKSTTTGYFNNSIRKNQGYLDFTVATIIALVAGRIKYLFAQQNQNLFRGYTWVSVIDGKTSDYCIVRHTQYWDFDDNSKSTLPAEEYPPGHYRCRSGISYIYRGDAVPDMPTYGEWFERQPEKVQREILGQGRFDLYTKGELDINSFIDAESGRRITLDGLRNLTKS